MSPRYSQQLPASHSSSGILPQPLLLRFTAMPAVVYTLKQFLFAVKRRGLNEVCIFWRPLWTHATRGVGYDLFTHHRIVQPESRGYPVSARSQSSLRVVSPSRISSSSSSLATKVYSQSLTAPLRFHSCFEM